MKISDLCEKLKIKWGAKERLGPGEVGFYWTDNPELEPWPFHSQYIKDWENLSDRDISEITMAVELHRAFGRPISGD